MNNEKGRNVREIMVGFRVNEKEHEKMLELAKSEHRTLANFVRRCVILALQDHYETEWPEED